jgi:predicted phage terminase large subunit-like protein
MGAPRLEPQAGPQTEFLKTSADIAIYGGAAGGGKSYGLLLEPLRHHDNKKFGCVIFRRNSTQVRNEGGLWDESMTIYPLFRGKPREANLEWLFPSGARLKFAHLEYDSTVLDWQGAQIPFIGFDELTHFTEHQFFYMLSRNRSTSGVPGYIRATTNPDPDSWVRKFIDWWIGPDGYPIPERSGSIRWFIRRDDKFIWADTPDEIYQQFGRGPEILPKSVTFIPSKVHDNKILLEKDPAYLSNLLALSRVERLRLLGGNWNVREAAGMMFQREWFPIIDAVPGGWIQCVRYWDRAATKPSESNRDPDWTRGLKLYKYPDNTFVVVDLKSVQDTPGKVETLVKTTASHDTYAIPIVGEQDPGSAGVADAENFVRMLSGYEVRIRKITQDKITRAKPVSAQCEAGNIRVLRASWNEEFFSELENFPDGAHDDIVDVLSGAFNELSGGMSLADVL